jgi:hypothetical protein
MNKLAKASVVFLIFMLLAPLSGALAQTTNPTWNIQTVIPSRTDGYIDWYIVFSENILALNSQGNPCISYVERDNGQGILIQMYASLNSKSWSIEPVGMGGCNEGKGSFVLDSQGNPHIIHSYADLPFMTFNLEYASLNGSNWNIQTVGEKMYASSLAFDSQDNPQIIYESYDHTIDDYIGGGLFNSYDIIGLKYASWNGTTWNSQNIEVPASISGVQSLALDSSNNPHVVFFDAKGLEYAIRIGSTWTIQVIAEINGGTASLVLDSNGNPNILFQEYYDESYEYGPLEYASLNGLTWNIQVFEQGTGGSLALDSKGNPYISYMENNSLMLSSWLGNSWSNQTIIQNITGGSTSLALDSNGNPHICYINQNNGLAYAYFGLPLSSTHPTLTPKTSPTNTEYSYVLSIGVAVVVVVLAVLMLHRKRRVRKSSIGLGQIPL